MTHPITPPPELVQQWYDKAFQNPTGAWSQQVAKAAAQWGADQELDACCEWLKLEGHEYEHEALLASRRPKPPSLKLQALEQLESVQCLLDMHKLRSDTIRRALEALPND